MTSTLKPPETNPPDEIFVDHRTHSYYGVRCGAQTKYIRAELVENLHSPSPSKGMPTRYDFLVDAMGCIREHSAEHGAHMNAAEVLAALSERDKEIERLTGEVDIERRLRIADGAHVNVLEIREQELRNQLSALQSTPEMEREKALEEAAKVAESDGCTNSGCYGDEHTLACPCGIAAAIRALARPAEGKEKL
jgi:hypothetical protein